jgi:type III restriction enzyme
VPDFIAVTDKDQNVIVEVKGQVTDGADAKAKAAERWAAAVTRLGQYGAWHYLLVTDPGRLGLKLNVHSSAAWDPRTFELTSG